jgi:2-iminobutanoate/2-iminopropanoate deaminase
MTGSEVMDRQVLSSDRIPPAVGPYSQAVRAGELIFCSGVIGLDPETKKLVDGALEDEVRRVMDNLRTLLEDCGSSLDNVVKTTVFLVDMGQFQAMNGVYAQYFGDEPPARSTIQVAALPLGARVEVEATAIA